MTQKADRIFGVSVMVLLLIGFGYAVGKNHSCEEERARIRVVADDLFDAKMDGLKVLRELIELKEANGIELNQFEQGMVKLRDAGHYANPGPEDARGEEWVWVSPDANNVIEDNRSEGQK